MLQTNLSIQFFEDSIELNSVGVKVSLVFDEICSCLSDDLLLLDDLLDQFLNLSLLLILLFGDLRVT